MTKVLNTESDNNSIVIKGLSNRYKAFVHILLLFLFRINDHRNKNSKMSWLNLLLLTFLLCNSGFPGLLVNASNAEFQLESGNSKGKIKLADVVLDVLLMIFEQLELTELINMAATHSNFDQIAETVFHHRYPHYKIRIVKSFFINNGKTINYQVEDGDSCIEFPDSKLVDDLFKYAGKWIQRLAIKSDEFTEDRLKSINGLINKYTSESVIQLDLRFVFKDSFGDFMVPFKNVEHLMFGVLQGIPSANMMPLNELFPKLRRLEMRLYRDFDHNLLDYKFPHLEHLTVELNNFDTKKRIKQIECLLRKNPQIRSIKLLDYPKNYIKVIENMFINLENMTLDALAFDETVHFANVKSFQWSRAHMNHIALLSLPRLEFLRIDTYNPFTELKTFLERHKNVSRLHLKIRADETAQQELVDLIAVLPNLVELILVWEQFIGTKHPIGTEFIAQIIQNHEGLMKIEFPVNQIGSKLGKYENDWHLRNFDFVYIFQRKVKHFL